MVRYITINPLIKKAKITPATIFSVFQVQPHLQTYNISLQRLSSVIRSPIKMQLSLTSESFYIFLIFFLQAAHISAAIDVDHLADLTCVSKCLDSFIYSKGNCTSENLKCVCGMVDSLHDKNYNFVHCMASCKVVELKGLDQVCGVWTVVEDDDDDDDDDDDNDGPKKPTDWHNRWNDTNGTKSDDDKDSFATGQSSFRSLSLVVITGVVMVGLFV